MNVSSLVAKTLKGISSKKPALGAYLSQTEYQYRDGNFMFVLNENSEFLIPIIGRDKIFIESELSGMFGFACTISFCSVKHTKNEQVHGT
jgi:hypothetical protein